MFKWDFYQLNDATSPSTMAMMQMMLMHTYIHGRIFPTETYQVLWANAEIPFARDHKTSVAAYGDETDVS